MNPFSLHANGGSALNPISYYSTEDAVFVGFAVQSRAGEDRVDPEGEGEGVSRPETVEELYITFPPSVISGLSSSLSSTPTDSSGQPLPETKGPASSTLYALATHLLSLLREDEESLFQHYCITY